MIDKLETEITDAVSAGFRNQLLERGQARSMIWSDGILPEDSPKFAPQLSYDLLSYGYSLINKGFRLLELGGDPEVYRLAFSKAGSAIEMVVHKGKQDDPSRGFHLILAAASYHLGRYSAKAYSLLKNNPENITTPEKALRYVILRELNQLDKSVLNYKATGVADDQVLAELIDKESEHHALLKEIGEYSDESKYELSIVDIALTDNYMSAVSTFLMALELGEQELLSKSTEILSNNLDVCNKLNMLPQWWVNRITKFLFNDLWLSSFHKILPIAPTAESVWNDLRWKYIALLHKRKKSEIDLWPSQIEGAMRAVDLSDNLVVSLPTSAGKTRIAEICILRCLADGKRVIFITPLRALSAQTEFSLRKTFSPLGKTVSTLYGSIGVSEFEINAIKTNDIVVGTPEKLDFALRNDSELIDDVGLVVLDEGHMIGLSEREIRYEVQIQRLLNRPDADQRRIVCLSAILPEGDQLNDFVGWIRRDVEGNPVKNNWRPTDLRFGEVTWENNRGKLKFLIGDEPPFVNNFISGFVPPIGKRKLRFPKDAQELSLATAWRLIEDGHTVLIYCAQKNWVESFAKKIVDLNARGALKTVLTVERNALELAKALGDEWLGVGHPIIKCLELGVAIHHGSLPTPFRKEMEKLLRDGVLTITVSSPTLAQGLNLSATTVIMHSLRRSGQIIEASEFKNVIGRAGRAFVDTQGLILHPMFDKHSWRGEDWNNLIENENTRNMLSGLYRLIFTLVRRMAGHLETTNPEDVLEYIVNNSNCWDFKRLIKEKNEIAKEESEKWAGYISSLDTALLSLLGNEECDEKQIPDILDRILSSSLLERVLSRKQRGLRILCKQALIERSNYIWGQSSVGQRKGYFLAGVGLETGNKLDAIADTANQLLVESNYYIVHGKTDKAINSITQIAELIFSIAPFTPKKLPESWKNILKSWLLGEPVTQSDLGEVNEIISFVEDGFVYRLPWGMEAIKVRAIANNDIIPPELSIEDFETGVAVPAIENGTLNRSAAMLMQAGFNSRHAAIKAINDTKGSFDSSRALSLWLRSKEVIELTATGHWPTPETSSLWKTFIADLIPSQSKVWTQSYTDVSVKWFTNPLPSKTKVRLVQGFENTNIVVASGEVVGQTVYPIKLLKTGVYYAIVSETETLLNVEYLGAGEGPFDALTF